MSEKHTPGPWARCVWRMPDGQRHIAIVGGTSPSTGAIALTGLEGAADEALSIENADRIVRCVNTHDELVDALREVLAAARAGTRLPETTTKAHAVLVRIAAAACRADAVIAQATGQTDGVAQEIFAELQRATRKFPTWPTDPLHAVAVLGEEFGELTKAALQLTYEPHKTSREEVRTEAIQTAAMALRFAMSLGRYEYQRCEQHKQSSEGDRFIGMHVDQLGSAS